jgi:hypothetical protein
MAQREHKNIKATIMTDYNATLQYVNGKVYELKGLDSAFHIHEPQSENLAFYAPEHYNQELFIQLKNGEKMIFEQVPEVLMASLEPNDANIDAVYQQLVSVHQPKRATDAALREVALKDLVDLVCHMQYFITTTNGLWATDEPDAFRDHPARHLLWQVLFKPNESGT